MWSINLSASTTRVKASEDITFTTTYLENIYRPLKAGIVNPFIIWRIYLHFKVGIKYYYTHLYTTF